MNILRIKTTKGLNLGKPEAEAERQFMLDYFEDYFNIKQEIENGCFIISGRKGSGKSAYAVWMQQHAVNHDNEFCSLVKKDDFNLELIINSLPEKDVRFEAFFEWVILVRLVKLILESNIGTYLEQVRAIKKFYERNTGYVNIDKYSIAEIVSNSEVNFAPLKSCFGFFNRFFGTKSIKAPFYKMIAPLRDTVLEVLRMPIFKDVKFNILFDDLDVKLKLSRVQDKIMLLDLIRIARRYNTEYLADTNAKILIFLRDDIGDRLRCTDADKNKIFSSYEHCINWYEHDIAMNDEKRVLLRQFINKRIALAFDKAGYQYDNKDPWVSFVSEDSNQKTSFKYILDHTFYLPRDFITIFKDISSKNMKLPLSHKDINTLLREYAPVKKSEIEDELFTIIDDKQTIDTLFKVLHTIGEQGDVSYEKLMSILSDFGLNEQHFFILLDYSLLIRVDANGFLYFNYREQNVTQTVDKYEYTIPRFLKVYYRQI